MSNCPTVPTSTTGSSTSCPSRASGALAVIACGALANDVRRLASARAWDVELHALPSLLHNRPERIAPAVERLAGELLGEGRRVAVAYADCGTYGALDDVCRRLGLERLGGLHCYDVLAGADRLRALFDDEPGTYLLTDFLVASFHRSVVVELGLDRHPELLADYFGSYRRVVWIAQRPTTRLHRQADSAAAVIGLPLEVHAVGLGGLEDEVERLVAVGSARA
jgi:hypothetical protein